MSRSGEVRGEHVSRGLRVLVVHNRYSSKVPSGENLSVADEVRWLGEAGVEVELHTVSNDDVLGRGAVRQVRQALETPWSPAARRRFEQAAESFRPDVVHVHNLFPLLTASVPWAALRRDLPVVWTVRNHRLVCVDGTHFRDGAPCHLCRPGWRLPGIRYGCYRDSKVGSALVTAATAAFGRVARRRLTAVAISRTMRDWLVDRAAFPAERVRVKYNGIAPPPAPDAAVAGASRSFLFVGKLAPYKGLDLLLDAWRRAALPDGAELRILGDGPMASEVAAAAGEDRRITWVGHVPAADIPGHLAAARAVIVPSVWDEPFGRVAAEALAHARPVITTGLGGLQEIVDERCGWLTGTDPEHLAKAIAEAAASDTAVADRAAAAVHRHRQLFSPEATTEALIAIYESCLSPPSDAG